MKLPPMVEMQYKNGMYKGRCQGGLPEGKVFKSILIMCFTLSVSEVLSTMKYHNDLGCYCFAFSLFAFPMGADTFIKSC